MNGYNPYDHGNPHFTGRFHAYGFEVYAVRKGGVLEEQYRCGNAKNGEKRLPFGHPGAMTMDTLEETCRRQAESTGMDYRTGACGIRHDPEAEALFAKALGDLGKCDACGTIAPFRATVCAECGEKIRYKERVRKAVGL